ncbi:TPA: hypothetical protein RSW61_001932 [Vibrio harveyi]|nr:hypothetical protein [Vibrio harveyi]
MPRKPLVTDNTEVRQYTSKFDPLTISYSSLPSWLQDILIAACRCNLSSTEDLPDEGTAFFIFKGLRELNEISTYSVSSFLSERGMGSSVSTAKRWAQRFRYASDAILFHGERNFFNLGVEETDIYTDLEKLYEEFPDDPDSPIPSSTSSPIRKERLEDILEEMEGRKWEASPVSKLDMHIWNLKNDYKDGFLANQFKHIIKEDDVIVDTKTGEVLEFLEA